MYKSKDTHRQLIKIKEILKKCDDFKLTPEVWSIEKEHLLLL